MPISGDFSRWILPKLLLFQKAVSSFKWVADMQYFGGYFIVACCITKGLQLGNPEWKPLPPGLRMTVTQWKNRWWWDSGAFWHGASKFSMIFCCLWMSTSSATNGHSSCNNTAAKDHKGLWLYFSSEMGNVTEDFVIAMLIKKFGICCYHAKDC